jgi:hypothetical protein
MLAVAVLLVQAVLAQSWILPVYYHLQRTTVHISSAPGSSLAAMPAEAAGSEDSENAVQEQGATATASAPQQPAGLQLQQPTEPTQISISEPTWAVGGARQNYLHWVSMACARAGAVPT